VIEFQDAEGNRKVSGYLALPKSGEGPGVIVFHAWWGLTSFFKGVCERLAEAGFVALAPDLYQGKSATTINEAKQLITARDFDRSLQDINGAIEYLRKLPSVRGNIIGAIGFSMGGSYAFGMSSDRPEIAAVVAFYGLELGPDYSTAKAAYLGHFAELDEWESAEDVTKMEAELYKAGKEVTFYTYPGTKHWFFEENHADAYDAEAAQLAWERSIAFLHRHLM